MFALDISANNTPLFNILNIFHVNTLLDKIIDNFFLNIFLFIKLMEVFYHFLKIMEVFYHFLKISAAADFLFKI